MSQSRYRSGQLGQIGSKQVKQALAENALPEGLDAANLMKYIIALEFAEGHYTQRKQTLLAEGKLCSVALECTQCEPFSLT